MFSLRVIYGVIAPTTERQGLRFHSNRASLPERQRLIVAPTRKRLIQLASILRMDR